MIIHQFGIRFIKMMLFNIKVDKELNYKRRGT